MPRNHTHTSHNYSDSQKDALSKCYELESKIDHIEKWMKVAAILTLVIGAPVILFLGIAFALQKIDSWILFTIGGVVLAGLIVAIFFIIRAQLKKHKMKREIKKIVRESGIDFVL